MDSLARLLTRRMPTPLRSAAGQGMIEWVLIVSLISVVAIVVIGSIGTDVVGLLTRAANAM